MARFVLLFTNWKTLALAKTGSALTRSAPGSITQFLNGFASAVNWFFEDVCGGALSWSATKIFGIIVASTIFIWTFDWNTPDEQIEKIIKNYQLRWFSQLGETVGTTLGWAVCGLVPSAVILKFNTLMGAYVLARVGEEAWEEIYSEWLSLIRLSVRNKVNEQFLRLFVAFRWLIKNAANGESDTLLGGMIDWIIDRFPGLRETLKLWGNKGGKPWIIATAVEEKIENSALPQNWKNFLEEFLESFADACMEAGYMVAGAIDQWIQEQRIIADGMLGEPTNLVVIPNRQAPDEQIILSGGTELLRPALTTVMAQYQMIDNRDVGMNIGGALVETAEKQLSEFALRIFWTDKPNPPYGSHGNFQLAYATIGSVERAKMDFNTIKRWATYPEIFFYGNYWAKATLNDGSSITLWARTEAMAIDRIKGLLNLSSAQLKTLNSGRNLKEGIREEVDELMKQEIQLYPAYCTVLNRQKILVDVKNSRKKATKQGYFKNTKYKLQLWQETKPDNWDEILNELFGNPGTNV